MTENTTKTRKKTPQTFTVFQVLSENNEVSQQAVRDALDSGRQVFVALPDPVSEPLKSKNAIMAKVKRKIKDETPETAVYSGRTLTIANYPAPVTFPAATPKVVESTTPNSTTESTTESTTTAETTTETTTPEVVTAATDSTA